MKIKVGLTALSLLVLFTSCQSLALHLISRDSIDKDVKVLSHKQKDRSIAFLPMIHVGKPGYYESAKKIIDSLHTEGFIVFYEGVGLPKELDSLSRDTLQRKMRKLTGVHISSDYTDPANKSLPKVFKNKKYVMQDYKMMGITENDRLLDLDYEVLIQRYEADIKTIKLLSCDFETPLLAVYDCKDNTKYDDFHAIQTLRNDHLIDEVVNAEEKKIAIIYGKAHWKFLYGSLMKKGYELTEGKAFGFLGIF